MRGVRNDALRDECVRLRVEERLSITEIGEKTGASKGSLSGWLAPYPLTEEEIRSRRSPHCGNPRKDRGEESPLHQMAAGKVTSPLQKGKVAEVAVLLRMVIFGLRPYTSPFDGDRTDWIVEVPGTGRLWKVQVKLARDSLDKVGLPSVSLRCCDGVRHHRKYRPEEFDFIVGYVLFTDTCYVWSQSEVEHLTTSVTVEESARERWDKLVSQP